MEQDTVLLFWFFRNKPQCTHATIQGYFDIVLIVVDQ